MFFRSGFTLLSHRSAYAFISPLFQYHMSHTHWRYTQKLKKTVYLSHFANTFISHYELICSHWHICLIRVFCHSSVTLSLYVLCCHTYVTLLIYVLCCHTLSHCHSISCAVTLSLYILCCHTSVTLSCTVSLLSHCHSMCCAITLLSHCLYSLVCLQNT